MYNHFWDVGVSTFNLMVAPRGVSGYIIKGVGSAVNNVPRL